MITIKIVGEKRDLSSENSGFAARIIELQTHVFETLFEGLHCDNLAHKDFENIIIVNTNEAPIFKIQQVCCRDFEMKIIKAVM